MTKNETRCPALAGIDICSARLVPKAGRDTIESNAAAAYRASGIEWAPSPAATRPVASCGNAGDAAAQVWLVFVAEDRHFARVLNMHTHERLTADDVGLETADRRRHARDDRLVVGRVRGIGERRPGADHEHGGRNSQGKGTLLQ